MHLDDVCADFPDLKISPPTPCGPGPQSAIVGDDALDVVGSSSKTNYKVASPKPLAELIHDLLANGSNKALRVKDWQYYFSLVRGA
ncbi:MAG: hypothetical protein M1305_01570 [Candidatus Marsarchaeota archaeon]|nr:hypothetical protein [Candidatus Marsarchaeota archaeon]